MALYFRTWKMSVAAIIALLHDLVITVGVYACSGFEITPAAVIGFLTILGYSLYDTVVVFDKIRENTTEDGDESRRTFGESVNLAVNQTLVRSINTSRRRGCSRSVRSCSSVPFAARCGHAARHLAGALHRNDRRHVLDDLRRRAALLAAAREREARDQKHDATTETRSRERGATKARRCRRASRVLRFAADEAPMTETGPPLVPRRSTRIGGRRPP